MTYNEFLHTKNSARHIRFQDNNNLCMAMVNNNSINTDNNLTIIKLRTPTSTNRQH